LVLLGSPGGSHSVGRRGGCIPERGCSDLRQGICFLLGAAVGAKRVDAGRRWKRRPPLAGQDVAPTSHQNDPGRRPCTGLLWTTVDLPFVLPENLVEAAGDESLGLVVAVLNRVGKRQCQRIPNIDPGFATLTDLPQ